MNDAFPEIVEAAEHLPDGTVLDGELLAAHPDNLLPFSMLSRRASRKRAGKKIRSEIPAVFVAYDLLEAQGKDIRSEPLFPPKRTSYSCTNGFPTKTSIVWWAS